MHSISGSSMLAKYDRLLVVMTYPARRNRSTVAFSRLPLGMPSFSFTPCLRRPLWDRRSAVHHFPNARIQAPEEAAFVAFMADAGALRFHLHQHRIAVAIDGDFLHQQPVA